MKLVSSRCVITVGWDGGKYWNLRCEVTWLYLRVSLIISIFLTSIIKGYIDYNIVEIVHTWRNVSY